MSRNRILWGWSVTAGLLTLALMFQGAGNSVQGAGKGDIWWPNFDQAKAESKRTGRPMLLHFHASWCPPCREMEKEIFPDREVQDFLASQFIPVKVDCTQPSQIANDFEIETLPTDLVVTADGKVLIVSASDGSKPLGFPGGGKNGRRTYINHLNQVLSQLPANPAVEAPTKVERPIVNQEPAKPSKDSQEPADAKANRKLIVGLERYSPVAIVNQRKWLRGKSEHAWEYQGVVYLMCDEAEAREFKNDPAKFAPKMLGCDPVVLWTTDKVVLGSTQFAAMFDENLYLFSSAENRDRFKKEPNLFSRPQHVLKVNEIDGPRWR